MEKGGGYNKIVEIVEKREEEIERSYLFEN